MKYFFLIFIVLFSFFFFNTEFEKVNFNEDQSLFTRKEFKVNKGNNSGTFYEYFKVEKENNIVQETLVFAKYNSDTLWEKQELYDMTATAYTPGPESCGIYADGFTYTEMIADYGIIAVDPRYIELGSFVYVENYGFAYAADIGGKIKGKRIDLCFEDVDTALKFGVKAVKLVKLF